jgi:N-acetylglucosaminyldiphosphoundecaprenol N-acetyl-beta-D-mannosaminyltransferase
MSVASSPDADASGATGPAVRERARIGHVGIDAVDFAGALGAIDDLVSAGRGGMVFTPNIDHVVLAEKNERFRRAYEAVDLSLVDGMPVVWASRLVGPTLTEKISGSDLAWPLLERARQKGWRVYLLGGAKGAAERSAERLRAELPGIQIVGWSDPRVQIDPDPAERDQIVSSISSVRPDLVLVALGAPKQEIWMHENLPALRPAVLVAVGATLDFIAGLVKRAPRWMSRSGLEWLFRLMQEPRRLAGRYLVRDPQFLWILARTVRDKRRR